MTASRFVVMVSLILALFSAPLAGDAQERPKVPRVGYVFSFTQLEGSHLWESCRQGLRELGYVEGQNIILEPRWAEGRYERLPGLVRELVRLKVDVMVVAATPGNLAAKAATDTIPIVFVAVADPVRVGLVASLARPGGNFTGLSLLTPETSGKRLQLLADSLRRVSRAGLHYTTVGAPTGEPVLILHGTTGSGTGMLNPRFAGELFGPGQPLDASRYFIILTDAIGHGKSSKPSDGLRASFPKYNYDDMVVAQYRLVTEHLAVRYLRLVLGHSICGMQTWLWAQKYPDFMDIAGPMASLPTEMSGRNWIMRRLIIDSIRNDPEWMNGNYTKQPRSLQFASVFYDIATNGGNQALYKAAPTREKADQLLDQRLSAPFRADANDSLHQWDSSRDYNASPGLERIQAVVLAINAADDERNPPELGLLEREIKRVKNGRVLLIPASDQTAGHGTTGQAKFWKHALTEVLQTAPRGTK